MNKALRILIGATLLCFAYAGAATALTAATAQSINIDPGGYTGTWTVDYGAPHQGPALVKLGPEDAVVHAHVISLGGAELYFKVGSNGIASVTPKAAATTGVGWLKFNTITVAVDPGFFDGSWRIAGGGTGDLVGPQKIALVAGLSFYNLELGSTGGFSFHVAADGTVTVANSVAAIGGLNTLTVNHTERFLATK